MTNTKILEAKIKESGLKKSFIAEKLGIKYEALRRRIQNEVSFLAREIPVICDLLGIDSLMERDSIFFADNVEENSTT